MSILSNIRIASKILLTLGLLAFFSIGVTGYGLFQMSVLEDNAQHIVTHEAESLRLAGDADGSMTRIHQLAFAMATEEERSVIETMQNELVAEAKEFDEAIAAMKLLAAGANVELFDETTRKAGEYLTIEKQVFDLLLANRQWEALSMLRTQGGPIFERVNESLNNIVEYQQARLRSAAAAAASTYEHTVWMTIATTLIGLLIVGALSMWIVRRQITGPISNVTASMGRLAEGDLDTELAGQARRDEIGAMARAVQVFKDNAVALGIAAAEKARLEAQSSEQEKIAEEARRKAAHEQAVVVGQVGSGLDHLVRGDLTFRIEEEFAPEYRKLQDDFNAAMGQLQETMKVISANTLGIRSGTDEISQAADDLSRRTEQQAASLEETAAALDQITATVKKTAEGALHAREVVGTAKADAERSGIVVRDAVAAMSEIERSAKQISQIIGVIDEIAFQTNLLALNAGVEAARAGDAGRGFAVVASEVRALAQRSAEAAKEIKSLISASTAQVDSGVKLVGETGKALARIVSQVAEINGVVAEIAASAKEQATGLNEVNSAVNQMDQVTQQNAAMVEQSTAASHSLAQEAEELARLIGRFRTGEEEAQAPAPAQRRKPARTAAALKVVSGRGGAARKPEPAAEDSWEEF